MLSQLLTNVKLHLASKLREAFHGFRHFITTFWLFEAT